MAATPASPPAPPDFRQHFSVETPEHVALEYEVAGIGSRILAAVVDQLIIVGWGIAVAIIAGFIGGGPFVGALMLLLWGAGSLAYFVGFEAFRQGQTIGKRANGIRVVRETGHPVTFGAALARNVLRAADFLPVGYLVGLGFVMLHPRARRLGDLVAGTVVVRDRPEAAPAPVAPEVPAHDVVVPSAGTRPQLTDDEYRLLSAFVTRRDLEPAVTSRVAAGLVARLADRFPVRTQGDVAFLRDLHQVETVRRGSAPAAAQGTAVRFVARRSGRWAEFQALAARAAERGLDSFAAAELPDFAARYREVAADLARARTYGVDPHAVARLERAVAAGHNVLYRDERNTGARVLAVLFRECPAAIVRAAPAVLLALACLFGPAAAGWMLIRERPALAYDVLPDVMIERAAAGHARLRQGLGYFEAPTGEQPVMAAEIINNNVRVAFSCFAGGIFVGVGSLVLLGYNGLELGATAAHFANQGLLGYLLAFIIGHGVLELFAISLAGAAGFLLGRAVIAPGDHPRGEAVALAGRTAVRLVGAVVVLLVVAGSIEGMASASDLGTGYRLGISGLSVVFLALYLTNGWRHRRDAAGA
ncbi:MAG TPA: stage II sporulation protein M [Gemmatimonadales bacterium]|nr:stage II sporulation protein M [Gemmatimonadales bacterium]